MIKLAHVCIADLDATERYDARSMQRHGGVCVVDYVPRPRTV